MSTPYFSCGLDSLECMVIKGRQENSASSEEETLRVEMRLLRAAQIR